MEEEAIIREWNERQRERERERERDSARRSGSGPYMCTLRYVEHTIQMPPPSISHHLICIRPHMYWRIPMICAGLLRERLKRNRRTHMLSFTAVSRPPVDPLHNRYASPSRSSLYFPSVPFPSFQRNVGSDNQAP